ncbi:sugar O-acetyltransferase [Pokkaliibacter sp. CJK22405]|uniref:sugar O-acetyltransferase n=1 Tax=Pokkaliibacter sp. CJK22405 TaxID=3384615 RepID=UPI00398507CB
MKELEKAAAGQLYDANFDEETLQLRAHAKMQLFHLNQTPPDQVARRESLLRSLLGKVGDGFVIEGPFYCDYGFNIDIGDGFYANVNLTILDGAPVRIGNNVFLGPNVGLHTAGHPLDVAQRNQGLEYARPIHIADDVWLGAGVQVLPGVSIGQGTVIGAGSVVTKSIPAGVVAAGNPCRVLRPIETTDISANPTSA